MAGNVSKHARRTGTQSLTSRWGGTIKMKCIFENERLRHVAHWEKGGNTPRKAKGLM